MALVGDHREKADASLECCSTLLHGMESRVQRRLGFATAQPNLLRVIDVLLVVRIALEYVEVRVKDREFLWDNVIDDLDCLGI